MSFKSNKQPLCRCCGKPIRKLTDTVWVKKERSEYDRHSLGALYYGELRTKADCQRVSNHRVVSVSYHDVYRDDIKHRGTVRLFTTWDGESYVDEFFCTGSCATRFAYMVCRADLASTGSYRKAREKQREEA